MDSVLLRWNCFWGQWLHWECPFFSIVSYASLGFLSVPTASCSVCTDNLGSLFPHMQQLWLDHKYSSYWFLNLFFSDSLHKTEKDILSLLLISKKNSSHWLSLILGRLTEIFSLWEKFRKQSYLKLVCYYCFYFGGRCSKSTVISQVKFHFSMSLWLEMYHLHFIIVFEK